MLRVRFRANLDDYRPIKWPIKYPYWCSGYGDHYSIVIAYVDNIEQLMELWPEATHLDESEVSSIRFSSRFGKPDWYDPATNPGVVHEYTACAEQPETKKPS